MATLLQHDLMARLFYTTIKEFLSENKNMDKYYLLFDKETFVLQVIEKNKYNYSTMNKKVLFDLNGFIFDDKIDIDAIMVIVKRYLK